MAMKTLLAALLLLLGSGLASAQELFPFQQVSTSVGGGGSLAIVQTQVAPTWATNTGPSSGGACQWTGFPAIQTGDTVVGYIHSGNQQDNGIEYPSSVTDNAGNTYTLSAPQVWDPWAEEVGYYYATNIKGNPTTITLQFPPSATPYSWCDTAFTEYSGAGGISAIAGPVQQNAQTVSVSLTPSSPSMIWTALWTFGTNNPTRNFMLSPGYTKIQDDWAAFGDVIWSSNSLVSGAQTISFTQDAVAPGHTCNGTSAVLNGCPSVMIAIAISGTSATAPPVGCTTAPGPCIDVAGSTTGPTIGAGQTVRIGVENTPGNIAQWWAICNAAGANKNNCDGAGYEWVYSSCKAYSDDPKFAVWSGDCPLLAPSTPGNYQAVLFDYPYTVLATAPFTVTGGGPLSISAPSTVSPGGTLNVTVNNSPGERGNYLAICNTGTPSSANCDGSYNWSYLNCQGSGHGPLFGVREPITCGLVAPSTTGTYIIGYFANETYNRLAQQTFTVQ